MCHKYTVAKTGLFHKMARLLGAV